MVDDEFGDDHVSTKLKYNKYVFANSLSIMPFLKAEMFDSGI
jgi:hypothetical protein